MLKRLFYISFLFFFIGFSQAQNRKQLESKRRKLNREIRKVNKLLFQAKKKKNNALDDLKDLNQKINVRERLIETIKLEINTLSKEIAVNQKEINQLNRDLATLKKDYANMVFKSYKSKSQQSKTMFLLSSKSFYQAYKRLKYMKQYTGFRKKQGEEIITKANRVETLNDSLIQKKQIKEQLISVEKQQKTAIETDKSEQEKLISEIKNQEKKYKSDLQKKLKEERKIAAKIDNIIKKAIARSNRNRRKGVKKSLGFILNAESRKLASSFEKNKGKLPWPVNEGLVTRKFGVQPHPTLKSITINSTGLHITTKKGAKAKAIFNGKVLAIQLLPKGRKSVLVQHGNYITAYNNLESVFVKKNDKIRIGQILGKIFTNKVTGKTKLIFILFKNTTRLNPANWMLGK